jgi:hypothetical protein
MHIGVFLKWSEQKTGLIGSVPASLYEEPIKTVGRDQGAAKIHLPSTQSHHALTIQHYKSGVVTFWADTERTHRIRGSDREPMAASRFGEYENSGRRR